MAAGRGTELARGEGAGPFNGALAFDPERDILYAATSTRGLYRLRL